MITTHITLFTQEPVRSGCSDILLDIEPKGHEEVDDKWGAEGDKGQVYKIQPDGSRIDPHPLPYLLTNTEGRFFEEVPVGVKCVFYVVK